MTDQIVIIGGGQSGAQCAMTLRQKSSETRITIVTAEDHLPYQRPPLSKDYLGGELDREKLFVQTKEYYASKNINLLCGVSATAIDRNKQRVELDRGTPLPYTKLLIATGASHRKLTLPNSNLPGVFYLRSLDESDALSNALARPGPIVILGAGYIGLEVAATARKQGKMVTVIDIAPHVLGRVGTPPISEFLQQQHESHGVEFRLGAQLDAIEGDRELSAIKLSCGEVLECTTLLVGIGALIDTELAEQAGIKVDNGIVVDQSCRTSDPNIWASGDCAQFHSVRYSKRLRLESVPNATVQGRAAAESMLGENVEYDPLPWFWSDQYDAKYQAVGLTDGYDEYMVRGDPAEGSFSTWFFKSNILIAVEAINDPKSFAFARRTLTIGQSVDRDQISNVELDLKTLAV
jgi:3-phenylpropionate/trans-cinnamate dioxygenase ferredoxin reductase component